MKWFYVIGVEANIEVNKGNIVFSVQAQSSYFSNESKLLAFL